MIDVIYNATIRRQIIENLDGWEVETESSDEESENVPAFITDINEYTNKPNKTVKDEEVENFYTKCFEKALTYCNRFNVDDLSQIEMDLFVRGVCLLTASDLWNKYNIRVNNEDLEDTYVQSYGGLLYKQAVMILNSFINQRVTTFTSLKKKKEAEVNNNIWII